MVHTLWASVRRVFISEDLPYTKKQTKKCGFYWIQNLKVTAFKTKRIYTQVTLHTPTHLSSL